ncbi:MAG: hypothetical protein WD226_01035 [Planctomycetota bacterium]
MITPFLLLSLFAQAPNAAPTGEYVEARTASVFAGACHYNGEYTTQGRRLVAGWSLESGVEAGVDLSGIQIVALVECDENLAETSAPRRSIVHVDATGLRADAALAWLGREHSATLGVTRTVHTGADLAVDVDGDAFGLRAQGTVALSGDALADRACCKMPFNVWYEPAQPLQIRLVGCPETFRIDERDFGWNLDRAGDNNAFFGSFGTPE